MSLLDSQLFIISLFKGLLYLHKVNPTINEAMMRLLLQFNR